MVLRRHQRNRALTVRNRENEISSPSRCSSSTTRAPASPSMRPLSISLATLPASSRDFAIAHLCPRPGRPPSPLWAARMGPCFLDLLRGGADRVMRRRDMVPLHEFLREDLARLQPCRRRRRPKILKPRQNCRCSIDSGSSGARRHVRLNLTGHLRQPLFKSAKTHSASSQMPALPGTQICLHARRLPATSKRLRARARRYLGPVPSLTSRMHQVRGGRGQSQTTRRHENM